ncbi:MAG: hypothetical protein JWM78_146 [Verrucomicrobiaceae bacterium]|nr:hypothetical protein [Verrucomicrobiaceae bacterium]
MNAPIHLEVVDLRSDAHSHSYVKNEIVDVEFATATGELISREGPNRYAPRDALITGSTGDRWCVSRDRFDAKYEAVAPTVFGAAGRYRNKPIPVLAKQLSHPFTVARSNGGDVLRGNADDWLLEYAQGDYGVVENARFQQVYRRQD